MKLRHAAMIGTTLSALSGVAEASVCQAEAQSENLFAIAACARAELAKQGLPEVTEAQRKAKKNKVAVAVYDMNAKVMEVIPLEREQISIPACEEKKRSDTSRYRELLSLQKLEIPVLRANGKNSAFHLPEGVVQAALLWRNDGDGEVVSYTPAHPSLVTDENVRLGYQFLEAETKKSFDFLKGVPSRGFPNLSMQEVIEKYRLSDLVVHLGIVEQMGHERYKFCNTEAKELQFHSPQEIQQAMWQQIREILTVYRFNEKDAYAHMKSQKGARGAMQVMPASERALLRKYSQIQKFLEENPNLSPSIKGKIMAFLHLDNEITVLNEKIVSLENSPLMSQIFFLQIHQLLAAGYNGPVDPLLTRLQTQGTGDGTMKEETRIYIAKYEEVQKWVDVFHQRQEKLPNTAPFVYTVSFFPIPQMPWNIQKTKEQPVLIAQSENQKSSQIQEKQVNKTEKDTPLAKKIGVKPKTSYSKMQVAFKGKEGGKKRNGRHGTGKGKKVAQSSAGKEQG